MVRILVLRRVGLEGAGLYQAAWTLGGLYVGIILQAMGADFFPRLTASADNHATCNRLVNEQTRIGLLLATPGVIATLTYAPIVITAFYSSRFAAASEMPRWTCLGVALQVVTWPMGFIAVAKGKQALFFLSELAYSVVALGLAWACVHAFGLTGAGIAFFGSYIFHTVLTYPIARLLSGFRWSNENRMTGLVLGSLIAGGCSAVTAATGDTSTRTTIASRLSSTSFKRSKTRLSGCQRFDNITIRRMNDDECMGMGSRRRRRL